MCVCVRNIFKEQLLHVFESKMHINLALFFLPRTGRFLLPAVSSPPAISRARQNFGNECRVSPMTLHRAEQWRDFPDATFMAEESIISSVRRAFTCGKFYHNSLVSSCLSCLTVHRGVERAHDAHLNASQIYASSLAGTFFFFKSTAYLSYLFGVLRIRFY